MASLSFFLFPFLTIPPPPFLFAHPLWFSPFHCLFYSALTYIGYNRSIFGSKCLNTKLQKHFWTMLMVLHTFFWAQSGASNWLSVTWTFSNTLTQSVCHELACLQLGLAWKFIVKDSCLGRLIEEFTSVCVWDLCKYLKKYLCHIHKTEPGLIRIHAWWLTLSTLGARSLILSLTRLVYSRSANIGFF